jgi:hypothetical protein
VGNGVVISSNMQITLDRKLRECEDSEGAAPTVPPSTPTRRAGDNNNEFSATGTEVSHLTTLSGKLMEYQTSPVFQSRQLNMS